MFGRIHQGNYVVLNFLCWRFLITDSISVLVFAFFISFILFFSSRISGWLYFMISSLCLTSQLVCVLFFWFGFIVFMCFLITHYVSLKQLFWILNQTNYRSFFVASYWKIIVFLWWCHVFLIFFVCSFTSCVVIFAFKEAVTSSSPYWVASKEKYSHLSALLGILRFSQNFVWIYPSHTYSLLGKGDNS